MDTNKIYSIIKVAKMYYELKMSQEEIAKHEKISKSTVSRMLQKGIDSGYIKVYIDYPMKSVTTLSDELKQCFSLDEVYITPVLVENSKLILKDVCRALSNNMNKYIHDRDTVGVSWGVTMNCLANKIIKLSASHVKIIQMNGSVPRYTINTGAARIVNNLAENCSGIGYLLPVPAIVDNKLIADTLKDDSQIKGLLDLARKSTTAIFSIGSITKESILFQAGYFKNEEYEKLQNSGAVGDICSRFFNINGEIVDKELDSRVVGISLSELRNRKNKIAVAVGANKVNSIIGALNGKYVNILYTDEKTAQLVLKKYHSLSHKKQV